MCNKKKRVKKWPFFLWAYANKFARFENGLGGKGEKVKKKATISSVFPCLTMIVVCGIIIMTC